MMPANQGSEGSPDMVGLFVPNWNTPEEDPSEVRHAGLIFP